MQSAKDNHMERVHITEEAIGQLQSEGKEVSVGSPEVDERVALLVQQRGGNPATFWDRDSLAEMAEEDRRAGIPVGEGFIVNRKGRLLN